MKKINWIKFFHRSHRFVGIFSFIVLALWSASGLLHPAMTWLLKKLPMKEKPRVSVSPQEWKMPIPQALSENGILTFFQIKNARIAGESYYRVVTNIISPKPGDIRKIPGPPVYLDARTGKKLENGAEKHAEELARQFSGLGEPISSVKRLEDFSDEYRPFRKILPVYRVSFSDRDGQIVFVDPELEIAADSMDGLKSLLNRLFNLFHTYSFLEFLGPKTPHLFTGIFAFACFYSGLTGVVLFFRLYLRRKREARARNQSRSIHAILGIAVSFQLLLGSFSGFYHAFHKVQGSGRSDLLTKNPISVDSLARSLKGFIPEIESGKPLRDFRIIQTARGVFYIFVYGLTDKETILRYYRAHLFASAPEEDRLYATELASHLFGVPSETLRAEFLSHYTHEYEGFSHKYLPVFQVAAGQGFPHAYVHTLSSRSAEVVTAADFWESLSFNTLHKFGFMDFIGESRSWRMLRDALLSLFTIGLLAMSLLGLFLLTQKKSGEEP